MIMYYIYIALLTTFQSASHISPLVIGTTSENHKLGPEQPISRGELPYMLYLAGTHLHLGELRRLGESTSPDARGSDLG